MKPLNPKIDDTSFLVDPNLLSLAKFSEFKGYSKIIYALLKIQFSNPWELHNLVGLAKVDYIRKCLKRLESENIVNKLETSHLDYKIIRHFWKRHYPNSNGKPVIFVLNDSWTRIIEKASMLFTRYFSVSELVDLKNRRQKYEEHFEIARRFVLEKEKRIAESIGFCHHCNRLIEKKSVIRKDYHRYQNLIVCARCQRSADMSQRRKWTKQH